MRHIYYCNSRDSEFCDKPNFGEIRNQSFSHIHSSDDRYTAIYFKYLYKYTSLQ